MLFIIAISTVIIIKDKKKKKKKKNICEMIEHTYHSSGLVIPIIPIPQCRFSTPGLKVTARFSFKFPLHGDVISCSKAYFYIL